MSVFTWTNPNGFNVAWSKDEFATAWVITPPCCVMCGNVFENGQRVWAWQASTTLVAHAACMASRADGIARDLAECAK